MGIRTKSFYIEKYDYFKSKAAYYIKENSELKKEQEKFDKILQNRNDVIKQKNIEIEELKAEKRQFSHKFSMSKQMVKKYVRDKREVVEKSRDFQNEIQYLSKDLDWGKSTSRQLHIEIILRTIITYNKLLNKGVITFNELAFLLIGAQRDAFTIGDVVDRYGKMSRTFKFDFKCLIEAGLFQKVYRKQAWNISVKGRDIFNDILRYIYEEKVGMYQVVKKQLIDE